MGLNLHDFAVKRSCEGERKRGGRAVLAGPMAMPTGGARPVPLRVEDPDEEHAGGSILSKEQRRVMQKFAGLTLLLSRTPKPVLALKPRLSSQSPPSPPRETARTLAAVGPKGPTASAVSRTRPGRNDADSTEDGGDSGIGRNGGSGTSTGERASAGVGARKNAAGTAGTGSGSDTPGGRNGGGVANGNTTAADYFGGAADVAEARLLAMERAEVMTALKGPVVVSFEASETATPAKPPDQRRHGYSPERQRGGSRSPSPTTSTVTSPLQAGGTRLSTGCCLLSAVRCPMPMKA